MQSVSFIPKVSIVIPVYNGSDYLRQAIDSALTQTYPSLEIIVVNDGSNDGGATEDIALSYGDKVRYFSKANGGVGSALNVAIKEMSGEYFSWLSHDDLYYPNKVDAQIRTLESMDRMRTIVYSDYELFSDDPDKARRISLPQVPPERFRHFITVDNSLHGCTLLVPRAAFADCGLFDEKLRTTQDYDLWFRMAKKYSFVHIPSVLVKGRVHAGQSSIQMKAAALSEINQLLSRFVAQLSEEELTEATHQAPCLSYAYISTNFQQRGFETAARAAAVLSLKRLIRGAPLDAVRSIAVLMRAQLASSDKMARAETRDARVLSE